MHVRSLILLALILAPATRAQSVVSSAQTTGAGARTATITLHLESVPLSTALDEIARQGGVQIGYRHNVVSGKPRVTLSGENLTVAAALHQVLVGTGLEAVASQAGGFAIREKDVRGQAQGVITGRIIDAKSGKGIAGATVSLGNDTRGVVTDEDGMYRLVGVGAGNQVVTVRLVGYAKQTRQIVVGEGATITVDFKLEPSASVLDQVIVTGTIVSTELKAVPNAITVITAKQIEERGITRIDQLFRGDVPGLFAVNKGSFSPLDEVTMFSRGATTIVDQFGVSLSQGTSNGTNPIKTYIDGVEMADSKYLSQIDPSSIERIEILSGPQASTIYGSNAINGVMQIFTKRGNSSKPQLTLSISSGMAENNFSNHLAPSHVTDANISGIEGRISYSLGSSWNYTGSWTPGKRTQRLSSYGGGRMEWPRITSDLSVRRGLTQNRQNGTQQENETVLQATGVWVPNSSSGLPRPQIQTLLGQTLNLFFSVRPFSWWSHDLGLGSDASTTETLKTIPGFSSRTDTTLSINPGFVARSSERYTTTMHLLLSPSSILNLTAGGDHWRTKGSSWSLSPLSLTGGNLPLNAFTLPARNKPDRNSGMFIQGQFSVFDELFLTYGVRADWNPGFGDRAKVKPGRYGVSFARDIGSVSVKLRGSYGRSIRPPTGGLRLASPADNTTLINDIFGSFHQVLANPDLSPEHQQGGEGGVELYLGSRGSLVVTRYNQTVDNLISLVGSTSYTNGPGLDSARSLNPNPTAGCTSDFIDADGYCYRYQQKYLNVGSIRNQGWEAQGSLNLGPFTTHGTYSWVKSRILGVTPKYKTFLTGTSFEPGRPFDLMPEHTWALSMSYSYSSNTASLVVNGIGMRYKSDPLSLATNSLNRLLANQPRVSLTSAQYRPVGSGYATADLNATHRFSHRVDGLLQITNLTDYYQNDFSSSYATIGRQTRLGLRWRLQ